MLSKEKITELVLRWQTYWNNDPMRMVDESYAEDCKVYPMLGGNVCNGREELRQLEQLIMKVDPTRRLDTYYLSIQENVAVLESDTIWENGTITVKACMVLRFNDEGYVIEDHTYSTIPDSIAKKMQEIINQ